VRVATDAHGGIVTIDHGGGFTTTQRHLESIGVAVGQAVIPGERLADIGIDPTDAGKVRHIHFEARLAGKLIDPGPLFRLAPAVDVGQIPPNTPDAELIRALQAGQATAVQRGAPRAPRSGASVAVWLLLTWLLLSSD
jgi:murein DD-endopeptidase MepM/ murein hydrolase activator NlpD